MATKNRLLVIRSIIKTSLKTSMKHTLMEGDSNGEL